MSLGDDLSAPLDNLRTVLLGALRFTAVTSAAFFLSNIILVSHDQNLLSVDFGSSTIATSIAFFSFKIGASVIAVPRFAPLAPFETGRFLACTDDGMIMLPKSTECRF